MKNLLGTVLSALVLSASIAQAGGPVVVVEEPVPVVEEQAGTSGGILPLLLVGIALCVALCGGDDDDEPAPAAQPAPG
ncbi:MAG TPA: hypothetical protein VK181_23025 [Rhizobium sp.]|jgi:hypothetical protein|nr:hypothetical protein [Rhizobium sp.]